MTDRLEEIAPNLHRWLTPSPHSRQGDDQGAGGWPRDVGSLLYERDGTAIVFETQVGADDRALWAFLDERVRAAERVVVALTASWHLRDTLNVIGRYGGEIRLHRVAAGDTVMQGVVDVRPFVGDGEIAPGVEAFLVRGCINGEVVYWLPEHAALVSGEVFHGRPDGLRSAPDPTATRSTPGCARSTACASRSSPGARAARRGRPRRDPARARAPAVAAPRLRLTR